MSCNRAGQYNEFAHLLVILKNEAAGVLIVGYEISASSKKDNAVCERLLGIPGNGAPSNAIALE